MKIQISNLQCILILQKLVIFFTFEICSKNNHKIYEF